MPKVKVWGGTHPDEKAALACAVSLMLDPIPNVSAGIANPVACMQGRRFADANLTFSYPGNADSRVYEERRAVQVLDENAHHGLVVDLHTINYNGETTACIDRRRGATPAALGFLAMLGIRNLLLTTTGMQRYTPNAVVLDATADGLGSDIVRLRDAFDRLANAPDWPDAKPDDFEWYAWLADLHVDQIKPDRFGPELRKTLNAFDELPPSLAAELGHANTPAHIMSWRDTPNENGFWGEVFTPVATPDPDLWLANNTTLDSCGRAAA